MRSIWFFILVFAFGAPALSAPTRTNPNSPRQVFIGVFEGGEYPLHGPLRDAYRSSLEAILPDSIKAVFVPIGFKSAEWDREKSRQMARELAANKSIDIVLAVGPWTVEDLLAAGFDRPIVALFRFDPVAEGLIGKDHRPIVDNLTVQTHPQKLANEIKSLTSLVKVKRLGFLYFPTDNDSTAIRAQIDSLASLAGFEVFTARGYNVKGTFAYFKAYSQLPKKLDALYIGPLWGIDAAALKEFFTGVHRDRVPTFTSDGRPLVERGAMASSASQNIYLPARFAAWKTAQIIRGAVPADLPIELAEGVSWSINETAANELGVVIPDNIRMHGYVVPAPPDSQTMPLNLVDALDRVHQQNPNFLATYDRIKAAADLAGKARAALLPQLSADASFFYADDNTVENERGLATNERAIGNLRLEWSPFSAVAIKAIQVTAREKELAEVNQAGAGTALNYATSVAFSAAYHANRAVGAWQEYIRVVNQAADIATSRAQFETNDRYDLSRLQIEQYRATVALHRAEADRAIATTLLNVLLGQAPDYSVVLNQQNFSEREVAREIAGWQIVAPATPDREKITAYLTKTAAEQNSQMRYSRTLEDQKRLEISRSNAGRLPRLGFSARLSYVDSLANIAGFEENHVVGRVGATISFPIFSGFGGKHERARLESERSALEYERDNIRLDLARQISDQLTRIYNQSYAIVTTAQEEPLANEHLDLAIKRFERVPETVNDFLSAAQTLRDSRLSLLVGVQEYVDATASLLRLTGWTISAQQITPADALLTHLAAQFPIPVDER